MNLAAQTLSKSVADALSYMCIDLQENNFLNAEATINFINLMNNIFDILNSRSPYAQEFKSAMKPNNAERIRQELLLGV